MIIEMLLVCLSSIKFSGCKYINFSYQNRQIWPLCFNLYSQRAKSHENQKSLLQNKKNMLSTYKIVNQINKIYLNKNMFRVSCKILRTLRTPLILVCVIDSRNNSVCCMNYFKSRLTWVFGKLSSGSNTCFNPFRHTTDQIPSLPPLFSQRKLWQTI